MVVVAVVLGISSPAWALLPVDSVSTGQEPVRVLRFDDAVQDQLRHDRAWSSFANGEGRGWQASFDEDTGTVFRAWGAGIPVDTQSEAALLDSLRLFLERNPALLGGVDVADLQVRNVASVGHTDSWVISLQRVVRPAGVKGPTRGFEPMTFEPGEHPIAGRLPIDPPAAVSWDEHTSGVPVWRGQVELRVRFGQLVMVGMGTHPAAEAVDLEPTITGEAAAEIAIAAGPVPGASHTVWGGDLAILPVEDQQGLLDYRLVWEVRTRTLAPAGLWVSFVDATTGELVHVHNEVRYVDGTLYATHDTRTVDGSYSVSPAAYALVTGDFSVNTDPAGLFSVDGKAASTTLDGTWTTVSNNAGENGLLDVVAGDNTWTVKEATQAEIDAYIFLNRIHEWGSANAIGGIENLSMDAYVNLNFTCNAFFDGNVNFYRNGDGCNNTARISDVVHHEWGHGFHYYNIEAGNFDGSISEAMGDITAFLQTHDSNIGPYFYTGGGSIRDVEPDRVYPDDWVGEVHYDGLIFGGAIWDLWLRLEADLGAEAAYPVMVQLLVDAMKGGPDIPGSFAEFFVADDDDGDLSNGTPHECAIIETFAAHGLTQGVSGALSMLQHEPLAGAQSPELDGYPVTATVSALGDNCAIEPYDTVVVHYGTDGEHYDEATLALSGDLATGTIPRQVPGTVVWYYLQGSTGGDEGATIPTGGPITPFSFVVGNLVEIDCQDFEEDDGDYSHMLVEGEDLGLADDWQWGTPIGLAGDPTVAASGERSWGTDLGASGSDGEYEADKRTRLWSEPIDLSGLDKDVTQVVIQFSRWLVVEDGYYDQANFFVGKESVWTNHVSDEEGGEHHVDDRWMVHSAVVPVDGATLELAWELDSDAGLQGGGWNIDDVCVYALDLSVDPVDTGEVVTDPSDGGSFELRKLVPSEDLRRCGCATGSGTGSWPWAGAILSLVALARRRRS